MSQITDIEGAILKIIGEKGTVNSLVLSEDINVTHQSVVGAMKSLQGDMYVDATQKEIPSWKLTPAGEEIVEIGSPEYRIWALLDHPKTQEDIEAILDKETVKVGMGHGMKEKIFQRDKVSGMLSRDPKKDTYSDITRETLAALKKQDTINIAPTVIDAVKKRKLAKNEITKVFDITKGENYSPIRKKQVTDITPAMIRDGSWAIEKFKKLNFAADGILPTGGQLHPLLKVRQEFREIFLDLGFQEMETQQWVENSFWNFDSLFVPQKHPARDSQDTFFISKPATAAPPDADYLKLVKDAHEKGYQYEWSEQETHRNVLRTHTTSVTSWTLRSIAQCGSVCPDSGKRIFTPGRFFSIDRVFRNEEMDKTHLCEFHQIEGCIVDHNLSLANMMHILEQFFRRIGVSNLRFKPAYNPYTEPSMEIFGYHAGLKKWMEVGNSGMFRPEMLEPMGFDKDVTAIAWGLSLERPTMIKYGINHISELFGHKMDLNFIRKARIARYL
eukprot:Tbor_TRINITY_DN4815_c0_g1::TRINITY_DN4815_c0_g1_i1::g.1376::m.1376/K01889/FARSA, pheS; phenylalanyl-tRNA synthetase alpha chain